MVVNVVPFLVTFSRKIRLFTVEFLPGRTAEQLSSHLTMVVKLYARGDFSIRNNLMNQEFDKVVENMPKIKVNIAAAQEQVGEIEHEFLFIKESCRGTWAIMLLKYIPERFVIHLVYF